MMSSVFRVSTSLMILLLPLSLDLAVDKYAVQVPKSQPGMWMSYHGLSFEPMETADMRHVTMKTQFLVALATTKSKGELQALSAAVSCRSGDWILSYLPEFVANTGSAPSSSNRVPTTESHNFTGPR